MLEIFNEMKKNSIRPSSISYGIAIKAYGMSGRLSEAVKVYEHMKREGVEVSAVTYGCLINACIKNDDLPHAFKLYSELSAEGIKLNTILYTTLIKAYSKTGNNKRVFEIFQRMKEDPENAPNNVTYNSVLDCCVRQGDMESAERVLRELYSHQSLKPDIISFSTLIKGYIKERDLHRAVELLNDMLRKKVKPDEVLLNTLLDGCEKMKEYNRGVEIWTLVRNYIYPSLMSFSIMMKIYGKLNMYSESRKIMDELRRNNEKISIIIYTCYIRSCFTARKTEEAMQVYKEMTGKGLKPDEVTFSTMLFGLISARNAGYCKEILEASVSLRIKLKNYSLYEKGLALVSEVFDEEDMTSLVDTLEYSIGVKIDRKRFLKNWKGYDQSYTKTKPRIQAVTKSNDGFDMDYIINNYKHKPEQRNPQKKYFEYEKSNDNTTCDDFVNKLSSVIVDENNESTKTFDFNIPTTKAIPLKGVNADYKRKPFGVISTVNSTVSTASTMGFERGTKLSNKLQVDASAMTTSVPIVNESMKKSDNKKQMRINRF